MLKFNLHENIEICFGGYHLKFYKKLEEAESKRSSYYGQNSNQTKTQSNKENQMDSIAISKKCSNNQSTNISASTPQLQPQSRAVTSCN